MTVKRITGFSVVGSIIVSAACGGTGCIPTETPRQACYATYDHLFGCMDQFGGVSAIAAESFISAICEPIPEISACDGWFEIEECVTSFDCAESTEDGGAALMACSGVSVELMENGCVPTNPFWGPRVSSAVVSDEDVQVEIMRELFAQDP